MIPEVTYLVIPTNPFLMNQLQEVLVSNRTFNQYLDSEKVIFQLGFIFTNFFVFIHDLNFA